MNLCEQLADRARAMLRNCRKSPAFILPLPSATLLATDTLALRICEVRPYISDFGNDCVSL